MRVKEIDRLAILIDRMNGCKEDTELPSIVSAADIDAVRLAFRVLTEYEETEKQRERNNKDAIAIADWCFRNSETLQRYGERILRNNPECRKKIDMLKHSRELTGGKEGEGQDG